eukprot:scaffold100627_cov75-Phaeocystis_antarctica.AAC.4
MRYRWAPRPQAACKSREPRSKAVRPLLFAPRDSAEPRRGPPREARACDSQTGSARPRAQTPAAAIAHSGSWAPPQPPPLRRLAMALAVQPDQCQGEGVPAARPRRHAPRSSQARAWEVAVAAQQLCPPPAERAQSSSKEKRRGFDREPDWAKTQIHAAPVGWWALAALADLTAAHSRARFAERPLSDRTKWPRKATENELELACFVISAFAREKVRLFLGRAERVCTARGFVVAGSGVHGRACGHVWLPWRAWLVGWR